MNKLSGYKEFTLASGQKVEFKFSNATYELYAKMQGFTTAQEVDDSLLIPTELVNDGQGGTKLVPNVTFAYLRNLRLYGLAAAQYAALAQGKPIDFDEWIVNEWLEEIGAEKVFFAIDQPSLESQEEDAKKKPKDRIKASQ